MNIMMYGNFMWIKKIVGFALLFCGSLILFAETAQSPSFPYVGEVLGDNINIRSGPSSNYEVIGQASRSDMVTVWDKRNEWLKIEPLSYIVFWVHASLLTENTVNTYSVNVRAKPSKDSSVICQLEKGDKVEIVSIDNEWVSIRPPSTAFNWIHESYVKFYKTYDDYVQSITIEQERREKEKNLTRMWKEADDYEREQFYLPVDQIDFEAVKSFFLAIIDYAPDTQEAEQAKNRLIKLQEKERSTKNLLDKQHQLELQKETLQKNINTNKIENTSLPQKQQQTTLKKVTYQGVLFDLGVIRGRPGHYKLMNNKMKVCIIDSNGIDVSFFINQKVRVKGVQKFYKGWDLPTLVLEEIEPLK